MFQANLERIPPETGKTVRDILTWVGDRSICVHISHAWGGGILRHMEDLSALTASHEAPLWLRLSDETIELQVPHARGIAPLRFDGLQDLSALRDCMRKIAPDRFHLHNVYSGAAVVRRLFEDSQARLDITLHDFHLFTPHVHLADETGKLGAVPTPAVIDALPSEKRAALLAWQSNHRWALDGAQRIIAPSKATADLAEKIMPTLKGKVLTAWHPEPDTPEALGAHEAERQITGPLRVLVLGNVLFIKGWKTVWDAALYCRERHIGLDFFWLGLNIEKQPTAFASNFRNYGGYSAEALPAIIRAYQPHVIWFPSQVPETYCYTLSEAMRLRRPIVASALGAFTERLEDRPYTKLVRHDAPPEEWVGALSTFHDGAALRVHDIDLVRQRAQNKRSFYVDSYIARQ